MNKGLKDVSDFHELFEHPIGKIDGEELLKIRQLRVKLLFEEVKELAEATDCRFTFTELCHQSLTNEGSSFQDGDNVDRTEQLDALADIQYVLNGAIITAGFQHIFDGAFATVHSNNMSKAHVDDMHAHATIQKLNKPDENFTTRVTDRGVMLYNSSGKLIKPHDHLKVSLGVYLE